jgi:hypothetical protein
MTDSLRICCYWLVFAVSNILCQPRGLARVRARFFSASRFSVATAVSLGNDYFWCIATAGRHSGVGLTLYTRLAKQWKWADQGAIGQCTSQTDSTAVRIVTTKEPGIFELDPAKFVFSRWQEEKAKRPILDFGILMEPFSGQHIAGLIWFLVL